MKNRLVKIMGVVLTVAVLAGLLMAAIPTSVSAAKLSWSNVKTVQVSVGTNANVYCMDSTGKNVWLATEGNVDDAGKGQVLYKSTDGGVSWSYSTVDTNDYLKDTKAETPAPIILTKMVVSQTNANYLFATDGTNLYRSINGGAKWSLFNSNIEADVTSIAIGTDADGDSAYLAGYGDSGIAIYDGSLFTGWVDTDEAIGGEWGGANVLAVAFSPSYEDDAVIFAVVNDGDNTVVNSLIVYEETADNIWNTDMDPVELLNKSDEAVTESTTACIVFPSNWGLSSSSNKFWVGTDVGVFRAYGKSTTSVSYFLGEYNVSSLAYKGTLSSGTLAMGLADSTDILTRTDASSADSDDWVTSAETNSSPAGDAEAPMTSVQFSPAENVLYVGTAGNFSALSKSMNENYTSFAGISFFRFSSFENAFLGSNPGPGGGRSSINAETQYQVMSDWPSANNAYYVFKSTDTGATWKRIFSTTTIDTFVDWQLQSCMPTMDGAVYIKFASQKKFARSNDGGLTWSVLTNKETIDSLSPIDGTSYWVGSTSGVRKSTSSTYATIGGNTAFIMIAIPGFFVCTTTNGEIWLSTDMGSTFTRLGEKDTFGSGSLGFFTAKWTMDVGAKTFYAVDKDTASIVKYVVGEDTSWIPIKNYADLVAPIGDDDSPLDHSTSIGPPAPANVKGITSFSKDGATGVWYITSAGNPNGQIWRSTDLLNEKFEPVMSTKPNDWKGSLDSAPELLSYINADGSPVLWTNIQKTVTTPNYYPFQQISFIDTVLPSLTITAPAEGSTVGSTVTTISGVAASTDFSWKGIASTYKNAEYQLQIAYDKDFGDIAYDIHSNYLDIEEIKGTSKTGVALAAGKSYYWRVRVTYPMPSKWSVPVAFATNLSSDVNPGINAEGRIYPVNGASNVSTKPALTWGAVTGATGYDIKLASDALFTSIVEEKSGLTSTVFSPAAALKENTTYFWEVRAVSGTSAGQWVVSAFTTAAAGTGPQATLPPAVVNVTVPTQPPAAAPVINVTPAAAPIITVNVPASTPAPQETPAYIWVIIAVGAILVIAVIVLIARTRRV